MPVTIKTGKAKYKSESTGQYVGFNVIGETTTAQLVTQINSAGATQVGAVNTAGATQLNAVNTAGAANTANAKAHADAADASALSASGSESRAKESEDAAKASEDAASASELNAATSEANARASEEHAAGYELAVRSFAIKTMTTVEDKVSTDITLDAEEETRYVYGELSSLTIESLPESGIVDVFFTSGETATVVTLPQTVVTPEWYFIDVNTTYELCFSDNYLVASFWPKATS